MFRPVARFAYNPRMDENPYKAPSWMRFRLRTLLIVVFVSGPLCGWVWKQGRIAEWGLSRSLRKDLVHVEAEWETSKQRDDGSKRERAGMRHAELRYRRTDSQAREESVLYRTLAPPIPSK